MLPRLGVKKKLLRHCCYISCLSFCRAYSVLFTLQVQLFIVAIIATMLLLLLIAARLFSLAYQMCILLQLPASNLYFTAYNFRKFLQPLYLIRVTVVHRRLCPTYT